MKWTCPFILYQSKVWFWNRIETPHILSWIVLSCRKNISCTKIGQNSPPIFVDTIVQQVEQWTGIAKVRVQILLESTFFSWFWQCQVITKSFTSCISLRMILKYHLLQCTVFVFTKITLLVNIEFKVHLCLQYTCANDVRFRQLALSIHLQFSAAHVESLTFLIF